MRLYDHGRAPRYTWIYSEASFCRKIDSESEPFCLATTTCIFRLGKASRQTKAVSQRCESTFAGWEIPTAGEIDDPVLDKRFIDHVALSKDIESRSMRFISRISEDGTVLSDHNGVVIDVAPV